MSAPRVFRRLPACDSVDEAVALAEAIGGGRLVLHGTPSVPVVGVVELLLGDCGDAVAAEAARIEAAAEAIR